MKICFTWVRGLLFVLLISTGGSLLAEYVHFGDYATPGLFDGDLTIVNGNLDLKDSFTVNGDLKVYGGYIRLQSDNHLATTVDLYVRGDLITTNTLKTGVSANDSAYVEVFNGGIIVTGELFTRSINASAAVISLYGVKAGRIEISGATDAKIYVEGGEIDVVADIVTKSDGDAWIHADDIYAAYISTNGREGTTAYVRARGDIDVMGDIITRSELGDAYVSAGEEWDGDIRAGSIFTYGGGDAYVCAGVVSSNLGNIDVAKDIVTISDMGNGYVQAVEGFINSTNITTSAYAKAFVDAGDYLNARGDIKSWNWGSDDAYVKSITKDIKAKSITTNAGVNGSVYAETGMTVDNEIVTESVNGDAVVFVTSGGIRAGRITTNSGNGDGSVEADVGTVDVRGTINTKSYGGVANVIVSNGDLKAENVYTHARTAHDAKITVGSASDIIVKDVISTRSDGGNADVSATGDIKARSIETRGVTGGRVLALSGSIEVIEDISTSTTSGGAEVRAPDGNITAQKIKITTLPGNTETIEAAPGSARFHWIPDSIGDFYLENVEFSLDEDRVIDSYLILTGENKINGNGHILSLGPNGQIAVQSNASLLLKNIEIKDIWGNVVRCADTTSTLSVHDVTWTQTDDTTFSNGRIDITGNFVVRGPGTSFTYDSSGVSTINKNSKLKIDRRVTLVYDTTGDSNIAMVDESSHFLFNDATVDAQEDMRFTKGTLVFDNDVSFVPAGGKTMYFGDGTPANNIHYLHYPGAQLNIPDGASFVNQNA